MLVRILQARAGRIHGHYVLTRNMLAIVLPGQPRMFVHRDECTGVLPESWKLVLRNGRDLPLGSVSSRPYLKDLVSDLCKVWWPGFYGTPLWAGLQDRNRIRSLALRVDLRGHSDGRDPLLVYTVSKRHLIWQYVIMAACPLCAFWFYVLLYRNWRKFSDDQFSVDSVLYGISAVASLIGITAALAVMAYIARELFLRRSADQAFVVSRRSLALLRAGKPTVYQSADALRSFNQLTGRLYFCDGSSVLAAPYLFAAPYEGMLWMLFLRWRPGHSAQTGINRLDNLPMLLLLFMWACTLTLESNPFGWIVMVWIVPNMWARILEQTVVACCARETHGGEVAPRDGKSANLR